MLSRQRGIAFDERGRFPHLLPAQSWHSWFRALQNFQTHVYDGPGGSQSRFNFHSPVLIFHSPVLTFDSPVLIMHSPLLLFYSPVLIFDERGRFPHLLPAQSWHSWFRALQNFQTHVWLTAAALFLFSR